MFIYICFYIYISICILHMYIYVHICIYFLSTKSDRFHLLPEFHKRLHNVPVCSVISNSSYFTENISAFIDCHLKRLEVFY